MIYERSNTINNREEFIQILPTLLKEYEQHQQIYKNANISSFILAMQSTVQNLGKQHTALEWNDMATILETALFSPKERGEQS